MLLADESSPNLSDSTVDCQRGIRT